jgi:hypothetical protein
VRELLQPFHDLEPQRVIGMDHGFGQQLVDAIEDRVGQALVQLDQAHQRIGAIVDQGAQQGLVGFQRLRGLGQQRLDQRQVAPIGNHRVEHLAQQRRQIDPRDLLAQRLLGHAAQLFPVERFENVGRQAGRTGGEAPLLATLARRGEERSGRRCHVEPSQAPGHDLGVRKLAWRNPASDRRCGPCFRG